MIIGCGELAIESMEVRHAFLIEEGVPAFQQLLQTLPGTAGAQASAPGQCALDIGVSTLKGSKTIFIKGRRVMSTEPHRSASVSELQLQPPAQERLRARPGLSEYKTQRIV